MPGLRARKRQQTRERLTRAAMTLFLERGFEATRSTTSRPAADISRRSFFHYFASKEDVVFAWQEESTAALVAAVAARPASESMLTAAENAILAMVRQIEPGEAIAMACLKRDNPRCRRATRSNTKNSSAPWRKRSANARGHKAEKLQARLVAMIATGTMRIGGEIWAAEGAREKPEALAKRTFAAIRAILH